MTAQLIKDFRTALEVAVPSAAVKPALGKNVVLPAAVYSARNGMRDLFYKDSYGLRQTEFTVNIFSKTYAELQDLKESVVDAFHGFSGTLGTSAVSKIEVVNILDGFDTEMETVHRSTILINILD